ncbi:hypothetical protein HPB49_011281 [Dermacentor silvarum]|uniref:Uncharacterized protein n=1 Tax=Dermacentor silvarum TaxID=543639 RepID=A0ACB8CEV1_DERSI|nr:uncharacterized protein LOC119459573 [Dermacentor silvarum]KAH7941249.1 hypothetical protein HPB49_011281 [Dermacentor silvarum]
MMGLRGCIFALVLLVASPTGANRAQLRDGCTMKGLKDCGDDYVPYAKSGRLRVPNTQFREGCRIAKEQIVCSIQFMKNCTQGPAEAAALVVLQAWEENIEDICTVGSKSYKKYKKSMKCMESVGNGIHKCMTRFHDHLERAVVKAAAKDVIHHSCCIYNDLLDCSSKALAPCERVHAKDFVLGILDDIFGEVVHLVCGQYIKSTDACNALPPLASLNDDDQRFSTYIELIMEAAATYGHKN